MVRRWGTLVFFSHSLSVDEPGAGSDPEAELWRDIGNADSAAPIGPQASEAGSGHFCSTYSDGSSGMTFCSLRFAWLIVMQNSRGDVHFEICREKWSSPR